MLSLAANDYLTLRRELGFKLVDTGELLLSFTAFASERGDQVIVAKTALEWAVRGSSVQRRHRRLRTLELFVEHLRAEDTRHESLPMEYFPPSTNGRRYPPRIFSVEEIVHIQELTARLHPVRSIRPLTYRTLIGLLFTTGMRIGEALNLRLTDIHSDSLTIRQTKFGKSRWLPLHQSTIDALQYYLTQRNEWVCDNDRVFLSWSHLKPLSHDAALTTFQALCAQAGFSGAGSRRKPRLHDIRHSFATNALRRCSADRDAVEQNMLALSTYLGHVSVSSTYWYLEQTPELMRDIATACEHSQSGAIT
jgi:integrase